MSFRRPKPDPPLLGQESVWDYPRPPRIEKISNHLRVVFNGKTVAETRHGSRILETSHPPVYLFPPTDVRSDLLQRKDGLTFCEWKGEAVYYDVVVENRIASRAAFTYPSPNLGFEDIREHLSFYARPMDACFVDDELVTPQPGEFYSGWITKKVAGPFKGGTGTGGW